MRSTDYLIYCHHQKSDFVYGQRAIFSQHEKESVEILDEISKMRGIIGGVAADILSEWRKGKLTF